MNLSSNRVLRVIARLLQIIVALVLLFGGVLKALDIDAFVEQIVTYGIFPEFSMIAAWSLIIVEIFLAASLISNLYPKIIPLLAMALMFFFIAITWYGMSIGLGEDCGCFGNLVHRSPEQVITEDLIMAVGLLFAYIVFRNVPNRSQEWKIAGSAASVMLVSGLVLLSPWIPADDLVTNLKPGTEFTTWPVEGLYGTDLLEGTHLVFLFSVKSEQAETEIAGMSLIAQADSAPSTVGLIIDGSEELTTVMFQFAPAFPVGAVEPRFARPLYRTLPRSFLMHDGRVSETWSSVPSSGEVLRALDAINTAVDME